MSSRTAIGGGAAAGPAGLRPAEPGVMPVLSNACAKADIKSAAPKRRFARVSPESLAYGG